MNYNITYLPGTLTVRKNVATITLTADSNSWTYDGEAHADDGYTAAFGGTLTGVQQPDGSYLLSTGDSLTAVVEGEITDFGTVANEVTGYTVKRGEEDVTAYYTFGTA